MSLEQWSRNGWLQRSETTLPEIRQLLAVADREAADARVTGISNEGRFEHAYHAALQLCVIPLRASGYRVPKGQGLHKRAIDSLRYTLGEKWGDMADFLDRCSRARGQVVYEQVDVVSSQDADDLVAAAAKLRVAVIDYLKQSHAVLLPPEV